MKTYLLPTIRAYLDLDGINPIKKPVKTEKFM